MLPFFSLKIGLEVEWTDHNPPHLKGVDLLRRGRVVSFDDGMATVQESHPRTDVIHFIGRAEIRVPGGQYTTTGSVASVSSEPKAGISHRISNPNTIVRMQKANGEFEEYTVQQWLEIHERNVDLEIEVDKLRDQNRRMMDKKYGHEEGLKFFRIPNANGGDTTYSVGEISTIIRQFQELQNAKATSSIEDSIYEELQKTQIEYDAALRAVVVSGREMYAAGNRTTPVEYHIPAEIYRSCVALFARQQGVNTE